MNFQVIETYKSLYIVMELVEGGNLKTFIQNLPSPIDEELSSYIMKEILSGLQHIHMKNIIHRDIKPRN